MWIYSHELLGKPECPYNERWMLDFKLFSIRIHHWMGSDDLRHPHDHPWWFWTLCLKGGYEDLSPHECAGLDPVIEQAVRTDEDGFTYCEWCRRSCTPDGLQTVDQLRRGSIRFRPALHQHSVKIRPGGAWTILLTGREKRTWGFWVNGKFRKRNKYFFEHGHHPCDPPMEDS